MLWSTQCSRGTQSTSTLVGAKLEGARHIRAERRETAAASSRHRYRGVRSGRARIQIENVLVERYRLRLSGGGQIRQRRGRELGTRILGQDVGGQYDVQAS